MFLKTMAGVAVILTLGACATSGLMSRATGPSRYLAAWTGDADLKDSDFLAVLDVEPRSPQYGRVVTTVPIGMSALQPHHTEHFLDPSGILFGSGWAGDRTFRFDVRQPERPRLLGEVLRPKDIHFLHSFVRLPNGHVLATYQAEGRSARARVALRNSMRREGLFGSPARGGLASTPKHCVHTVQSGRSAESRPHRHRV